MHFVPVPPLAAHQLLVFMLQVAILLTVALCLGRIAVRFGMPAIVGELLTGVLLGPSLVGHLAPALSRWLFPQQAEQIHLLDVLGQVGILLLVGITGAQLDLGMVRRRGATAARVSLAGLLVPLSFGVGLGVLLPASLLPGRADRVVFASFLGVAMAVSAIPVIAKTLADMKLLHRNVGQLTLTAGMVDDAVAWFLLSIVSAMATVGVHGGRVALSAGYLVVFLVFAALIGRPVVDRVLRLTSRSSDPGPTMATAMVVIILFGAALTHSLGMEGVFGAFVAGLVVGSTRSAEPVHLAPLRTIVLSVFAPVFIASAGLRMDLTVLRDPTIMLAALAVLATAIVGKFVGAYVGARTSRIGHWESLAIGAGMNARGVVEVVVAMVGLRLGVLNTATYTIVVLVAIVTSLMAPPLLRFAMNRVEHSAEEELRRVDHEAWSGTGTTPAIREESHRDN